MRLTLKRTTFAALAFLIFILTYLPIPVSSLPFSVFQLEDRNSNATKSSFSEDKLVFDVSFGFVILIALLITYVWITARINVIRFIHWVNQLLAISIALVELVASQLYYFRIDTILRIATEVLVDANDARRIPLLPWVDWEIPLRPPPVDNDLLGESQPDMEETA